MTGHRSVYPSQVLAVSKSPSIEVELGKEIEDVESQVKASKKKVLRSALVAARRWRELNKKKDQGDQS